MNPRILFNCTYGRDDPERAILPFVGANVAAAAGQEAVVFCTMEAVRLGTTGGADGVESPGLPALSALLEEFVGNGGAVWLCGACTKPRGIAEADLAPGVTIVGAARVVEVVAGGAAAISLG